VIYHKDALNNNVSNISVPFPHDESQRICLLHKVIFSTPIPLTILKHYLINHYSSEI